MADDLCFLTQSPSSDFKNNLDYRLLILHDLFLLFSFVASYPLYSSYFIFFSPYLIKLISFISPLLIVAILLSLLLTTTTAFCPKLPQLKLGILQTVIQELKSNLDNVSRDDQECDFEIYRFVFDNKLSVAFGSEGVDLVEEERKKTFGNKGGDQVEEEGKTLFLTENIPESSVHSGRKNDVITKDLDMKELDRFEGGDQVEGEGKRLFLTENIPESLVHSGRKNDVTVKDLDMKELFEELDRFEGDDQVEEEAKKPSLTEKIPESSVHDCRRNDVTNSDLDMEKLVEELDRFEEFSTPMETGGVSDKVIGELRKAKAAPLKKVGRGSEAEAEAEEEAVAVDSNDDDKITQNSGGNTLGKVEKWRSNSWSSLGSYGSMKEDKEWRRTLACKLFEERHNSLGGEEGMDSLWEAYETPNSKNLKETMISKNKNQMTMKKKNSNNGGIKCFDDDDEDEDEEQEMSNGNLCCLQALKLSTGKMNLGMKKPNIVKISKALKGFGWLHHVKNKHGKPS